MDYFFDSKERKIWYEIEVESLSQLYLFYKGDCIGKMLFVLEDDCIELCDIVIFDDFPQFRNSGIGSWMFNKLKEIALTNNYKIITGKIVAENTESWQKLVSFYTDQGCEIEDGWFTYWCVV